MQKLPMHTKNLADENFKKLAELFPQAVTEVLAGHDENGKPIIERAIDKDVLMAEIAAKVVDGNEQRYQFTWPDKAKTVHASNQPIYKTLRPCREESVNFDDTENLYIEGDNLEVLKLLQESYLGKVKMIYIDPPYNRDKDFVYRDKWTISEEEFSNAIGQYDEDDNKLFDTTPNNESNGRFHTDWLNMVYPRLKVARDLLSEDGVIFISIDDNEVHNLRKICDEIFGNTNFVAQLVWAAGRKNDSKYISNSHEYIVCYVKSMQFLDEQKTLWREKKRGLDEIYAIYSKLKKEFGNDHEACSKELKKWYKNLIDSHPAKAHSHYSKVDSNGIFFPSDISWPGGGGPQYEVLHPITKKPVKKPSRGWVYTTIEKMNEMILQDKIHFGKDENSVPCIKSHLVDKEFATPYSVFYKDGRASTKRLRTLMGNLVFENPKDEDILKNIIGFTFSNKNSIILDFFSGSATTAHAVMQLNAEDGGKRKFIMVQLPEATDEKSEAYKAGYKSICEIGKERIRRAGAKIKERVIYENQPLQTGEGFECGVHSIGGDDKPVPDIGFRVLKVDSTNMEHVYYTPKEYTQNMLVDLEENIKKDRTPEDLLFQVMLELAVPLSSRIEELTIDNAKVFSVESAGQKGYLIACFESKIQESTVEHIAKERPYYFVMRDSSIGTDSLSTNFEQIFATYSPDTQLKVL